MIKETSVNIDSARETQDLLSVNKPINIPNVGELQRLLPFEKKYDVTQEGFSSSDVMSKNLFFVQKLVLLLVLNLRGN